MRLFSTNSNIAAYSEILKIAQYFLSIPAHNANCERIFSLINTQWSDERNRLSVDSVRHLVTVQFNCKKYSCEQFHKYLLRPENVSLLRQISSSEKYASASSTY